MDKLIELAMSLGPAALLIAALIFWGQKFIEYFFKETIELKKDELNQEFEIFKLKIRREEEEYKFKLDRENTNYNQQFTRETNLTLKKYQIETIKINRVLPVLEEMSEKVKHKRVLFATYLHILLNKGNPKQYEQTRISIHEKLLELSGKTDIYLPFELQNIINKLIKLVSNSFSDGSRFTDQLFNSYQIQSKVFFFRDCVSYLNSYYEAYYEIVSLYTQEFDIQSRKDPRVIAILVNHTIDPETFRIINKNIDVKNIEDLVLLNEFV